MSARDERRGDITLTSFAALLAIFSLAFAIYMNMIVAPDALVSVNARQSKNTEYRWRDPVSRAGDLATASILDSGTAPTNREDNRRAPGAPFYRLVAVAGSKAYVEEVGGEPGLLIAVTEGSVLSGAGRIVAIESRSGRWIITTTRGTITSDGLP